MKNKKFAKFSLLGFIILFATISVAVAISVLVHSILKNHIKNNDILIFFIMFMLILILTTICTLIDMIRRHKTVEEPTEQILEATQKITNGNFNIKLIPNHSFDKFDQYDKIMNNLNTMAEELKKNEVLKTDFISNVSHEIKTPLSIISTYATALQNKKLDDETRQKYSKTLVSTCKKLSDLISNILKLNKLENQTIDELEEFELGEFLRECVLSFEELFESKNISFDCDIDDMKIISSKSSLEIAINNLISNAIKFTEPGGKVFISLKQDDNNIIIKLKDTGCGIDEKTGKHIFDKFYQGDTSHSGEGNGLGLALVKSVIDNLGGEISVESKLNKGSTFSIKLRKWYEEIHN